MQETKQKKINDQFAPSGIVTLTTYKIASPRAREIDAELKTFSGVDWSDTEKYKKYDALVAELDTLCKKTSVTRKNIVVLTGRSCVARRLVGDVTYSGTVNYGALGTDNTAVNANDVALGAEVARKIFARRTRTNAVCNFDFFYSQSDTDGTYEEFGLFIDGTATVDSGLMWNHVLTGGWTKTDQEALTVSIQININQS